MGACWDVFFCFELVGLLFGVLGALICERSGTLNLGIEGIFVVGAMCGWMATWLGAGLWGGIIVAFICGAFFGLIHAVLTVPLGLSQHVSGLGITLFATSVSYSTERLCQMCHHLQELSHFNHWIFRCSQICHLLD